MLNLHSFFCGTFGAVYTETVLSLNCTLPSVFTRAVFWTLFWTDFAALSRLHVLDILHILVWPKTAPEQLFRFHVNSPQSQFKAQSHTFELHHRCTHSCNALMLECSGVTFSLCHTLPPPQDTQKNKAHNQQDQNKMIGICL